MEEKKEEKSFAREYRDENLPELVETMASGEDEKFVEQNVHWFERREYEYVARLLDTAMELKEKEKEFEKFMKPFLQGGRKRI